MSHNHNNNNNDDNNNNNNNNDNDNVVKAPDIPEIVASKGQINRFLREPVTPVTPTYSLGEFSRVY